jgi:biotin carboxyl carrier protein
MLPALRFWAIDAPEPPPHGNPMIYDVSISGTVHRVELIRFASGWLCKLDGRERLLDLSSLQNGVLSLLIDGRSYEIKQDTTVTASSIVVGSERFAAAVRDPRSFRSRNPSGAADEGVKKVTASMPGKVVRILVAPGAAVEAGQGVLVIEAMKMQNEMKSPKKGTVKKMTVAPGAAVEAGQVLAEVE